jgi:hypothetical protein
MALAQLMRMGKVGERARRVRMSLLVWKAGGMKCEVCDRIWMPRKMPLTTTKRKRREERIVHDNGPIQILPQYPN